MRYNQSLYEIKVANGSIFVDATDVDFKYKLEQFEKEYAKAERILDEKANNEDEEYELMRRFVYQAIASIEELFGEGTGDKIFPIRSFGSLINFMEELPAELEKAGVKANKFVKKRTTADYRQKYQPRSKRK